MAREVDQVIKNGDRDSGTITVITTDESGRQYASTESYGGSTSEREATEKATQYSLNKT